MNRLFAWLSKLSRNAALRGALLLLLGLVLLGGTEHADRLRATSEDALGGFVLTGAAAKPGPAANDQLVLAVGAPAVTTPARDAQFGVTANVPVLVRKVEMFQWNESSFAGQRFFEQNWYDHPIDSSAFTQPAGHANPGAFPIGSERFDSTGVTLHGFRLDNALVHMIPGGEPFTPDFSHLPPNMAVTFRVHDGALVTSMDDAHPQVGDLRVTWMQMAPDELSVLARDDHGTLVPTRDAEGDPVAQVVLDRQTLTDVLTDAPQPPRFKWARRVLAILLAWAGVAWLLPRALRRDRVLAFMAAVAPLALLASGYWFGVRTLAATVLMMLAIVAAVVAAWRWRAHGAQGE